MQHRGKRLAKYHLTKEQYAELLKAQDYRCAICLRPFGDECPFIDHDHDCCAGQGSCGKCVRGLLCRFCNTGLGHFGDAANTLRAAADYLENAAVAA